MRSWSSVLSSIAIVTAITLFSVWSVTTLTNEDPLWFMRSFDAKADAITVYWDGEVYTYQPGDPGYEAIMPAFADAVANWSGYDGQVAFSEVNIERYRREWRLLEMHFDEPVQVHANHPIPEARIFFVPLSKTHGHWRRLFASPGIVPWCSGPLTLDQERYDALVQSVEQAINGR